MGFALQLISFMVDFIQERMQDVYGLNDKELLSLFNGEDGHIMDDYEFFVKYFNFMDYSCIDTLRKTITTGNSISSKRIEMIECFIDDDCVFQSNWDFALSLMAFYVLINDCTSKDRKKTFSYFNRVNMTTYKRDFLTNEDFANEIIQKFLTIFINIEKIEKNIKIVREHEKMSKILKKWEFNITYRISTLNNILRDNVEKLYNYYLDEGISRIHIAEYIRLYFANNVDPVNTFKNDGFREDLIEDYKKMMLNVMIGDLYEDALNCEYDEEKFALGDYDEAAQEVELMARSKHQADFYLSLSTVDNLYEYVVNNPPLCEALIYNYFDLLDNRDRIILNRDETRKRGCIRKLARINPLYNLDDIR